MYPFAHIICLKQSDLEDALLIWLLRSFTVFTSYNVYYTYTTYKIDRSGRDTKKSMSKNGW